MRCKQFNNLLVVLFSVLCCFNSGISGAKTYSLSKNIVSSAEIRKKKNGSSISTRLHLLSDEVERSESSINFNIYKRSHQGSQLKDRIDLSSLSSNEQYLSINSLAIYKALLCNRLLCFDPIVYKLIFPHHWFW